MGSCCNYFAVTLDHKSASCCYNNVFIFVFETSSLLHLCYDMFYILGLGL
jgi:hypothetical protein